VAAMTSVAFFVADELLQLSDLGLHVVRNLVLQYIADGFELLQRLLRCFFVGLSPFFFSNSVTLS
jgi:hypothetical protein